jgi:hypothetical protein
MGNTLVDEGYTSKLQQGKAIKGGTCLLLNLKWAQRVIDYKTLGGNKT